MFNQFLRFLESARIEHLEDLIEQFVIHQALIAPILLLFIEESGIPLPVPGDVYLAFMGYQISKGNISYWVAFISLLIAVLLGASILYYISSRWGKLLVSKLGIYLHVDEKKLITVENQFKKYGVLVIIFGRHIPGFRIPITIFSGISGVPYRTFIVSTFISVIFWIGLYLTLGERVGKRIMKHFHTTPLYFLIICIPFIIFMGWIIYTKIKRSKLKKTS